MFEETIIQISKEELDRGMIPMNHVLCEAFYSAEGAKTKGGIIYGFNTELTFGSEDGKDKSSHVADVAETCMRVYRVPERLYFQADDPKSMDWDTDMELQPGDLVWTNPIEAKNATCVKCDGVLYKFIPYQELYVARRDRPGYVSENAILGYDIFCLNGYVLCEQVMRESLSELDVANYDIKDQSRGIVRFVGIPNRRHRSEYFVDFADVCPGDLVLFDRRCTPFLLERQTWGAHFNNEKLYWVIPRKYIAMILKRES